MLNVRGFVGIAAAMAATVGTTVASAQTPEVERLLRHGIELRQQGNNAEALAEFQRADQLANTPRTLAQMALAEQALGRWLNAETHLREALRSADDPWITRNRAALDGALGVIAQHVGQVIVSCDTNGAELTIGGRSAGLLPLVAPLRVEAGEVEVVARAEGRSASQRVHINAGETAQVVLHIGQVRSARSPSVRAPIAHADLPRATPETNQPGSVQRAFGWVSTVTGVLSLGVGVGGIVLREGAARSYNDDSRCPGENAPTSQGPTCQGYLDDVSLGNTLQLAGMIGGGALSLTGIILLATAPSGVSRATASVRCGVGPGSVGLICGGTF